MNINVKMLDQLKLFNSLLVTALTIRHNSFAP